MAGLNHLCHRAIYLLLWAVGKGKEALVNFSFLLCWDVPGSTVVAALVSSLIPWHLVSPWIYLQRLWTYPMSLPFHHSTIPPTLSHSFCCNWGLILISIKLTFWLGGFFILATGDSELGGSQGSSRLVDAGDIDQHLGWRLWSTLKRLTTMWNCLCCLQMHSLFPTWNKAFTLRLLRSLLLGSVTVMYLCTLQGSKGIWLTLMLLRHHQQPSSFWFLEHQEWAWAAVLRWLPV